MKDFIYNLGAAKNTCDGCKIIVYDRSSTLDANTWPSPSIYYNIDEELPGMEIELGSEILYQDEDTDLTKGKVFVNI